MKTPCSHSVRLHPDLHLRRQPFPSIVLREWLSVLVGVVVRMERYCGSRLGRGLHEILALSQLCLVDILAD